MKKTLISLSLLCMLFVGKISFAQVNHVVISQVYGGGGNAGAPFRSDFVELFNPTASPVVLTGWSVQYASTAGTFTNTSLITPLTGTIQPGSYYLVQEATTGTVTPSLPTPDVTGSINMSATAGKVALAKTTSPLTGTCVTSNTLTVDFVGFGGTACFEGTAPTATLSNTTSALRASNGCTDTDQNGADFAATNTITPRNSASPINCCLTPPTVTATALTTTVNTAYSYSIAATLASTYSVTAGALPTGLTLNAITGVISGTTTAALGSTTADITVTNCAGNAVATFSFTTINNPVSFTGGANQTFTVCQNTGAISINTLLQISDVDVNQIETWSVTAAPSNGVIISGATQLSNGSTLNPTGFTYMSNASFNGTDMFTVQVDDGSGSPAVTTITVTVNPLPTVSATSATICAGATATLTASGTATSYTWNTNETTTSISATPTTTTVYTVTGTSANNCINTATASILVNSLPTLSVSSASICIGATSTLTATGTATSYTWSTGDNTVSISPTVTTTTNYTVMGTDANNCINATTATITVNNLPTLNITNQVICLGNTATLTATGTATSYTWSTGDNTASISPTVTTTTNYTLAGADVNNCLNTTTATITVNPLPTVSVNNMAICIGNTATLTATGTSTNYTWSTGDNTASISPTVTTTTNYTVTGTDANNCSNMTVATITVNSLPSVSVNSATVCAGTTTTLTASGTATTYTWNTGDNTASITPTVTTPTNYTVTGTDANSCTNTAVATIAVNALPTVSVNSTTICTGQTTTLTATGTASSYTWSTGDNTASISFTLTTTNNYTVVGEDANGCTNSSSATVTVNSPPVISTAVTGNTCNGLCNASATVSVTSGVGPFTYLWVPGNFTTSTISNLCESGTPYNVLVTDANSCVGFGQATIVGPPALDAFFTPAATNTLCAGDSIKVKALVIGGTMPYTYLWSSVSGLNNSTTDSIVAKPTTTSVYTLSVTDAHGCTFADTVLFNVSNCGVGIKELANNQNISIYPNPATDAFYLQTSATFDNAVVEVYDMMGRKVLTEKMQGNQTRINLNSLNNAVYQVRVVNNGTLIYQSKIIKQQ